MKKFTYRYPRQYNEIYSNDSGIIIQREIPSQQLAIAEREIKDLKRKLSEANEIVLEFIENESFMRQVHPPRKMINESCYFSFDVWQQLFLAAKKARKYAKESELYG